MNLQQKILALEALCEMLKKRAAQKSDAAFSYGFSYRSKLKTLKLGDKVGTKEKITTASFEIAHKEWQEAVSTRDYSKISSRNLRILCSNASVVCEANFIGFLLQKKDNLSGRMIRLLMPILLEKWFQHPTHKALDEILSEVIGNYSGTNSTILTWKEAGSKLFGETAPKSMGTEMSNNLLTIERVRTKFCLEQTNNPFILKSLEHCGDTLLDEIARDSLYQRQKWRYFEKEILTSELLSRTSLDKVVGKALQIIDERKKFTEWTDAKDVLKDFCMSSKKYGDPRINDLNWRNVPLKGKEALTSWLSEEDLAFFFELIIRVDPHDRKKFWTPYLSSVKGSRVVIGSEDITRHHKSLAELKRKGRTFSTMRGGNTSGFILDFGNIVCVEFSEYGNACFGYQGNEFRTQYTTLYRKDFEHSNLKDQHYNEFRQPHTVGWQNNLRSTLARYGIRAEDR